MQECGFTVLKDVHAKNTLDDVNEAFVKWSSGESIWEDWGSTVRGNHTWLGFPNRAPFNKTEMIYNRKITEFIELFHKFSDPGQKVTLETVTFLKNPIGSQYQTWHIDDQVMPTSIKVHIPLVDVTSDMGPIELSVLTKDVASVQAVKKEFYSQWDGRIVSHAENEPFKAFLEKKGLLRECTVKGTLERGSALAYFNGLIHRGTPNLSQKVRTSIDHGYLTEAQLKKRYAGNSKGLLRSFPLHFEYLMSQKFRPMYHELREADRKAKKKKDEM